MKYIYSLISLSAWGVLIFVNIRLDLMSRRAEYIWCFEFGLMPIEFPLLCAVLHIICGIVISYVLIRKIRTSQLATFFLFLTILFVATLVFYNYKILSGLLYVI